MSFPDTLLDTTWTSYYFALPTDEHQQSNTLTLFLTNLAQTSTADELLRNLSRECHDYLLESQDSAMGFADDLIPEDQKRGTLLGCTISQLEPHVNASGAVLVDRQSSGLLVETRFQKAVARVVVLAHTPSLSSTLELTRSSRSDADVSRANLVLVKAPAGYVKQISAWLGLRFGVASVQPLRSPSELVVKACSQYLGDLSCRWTFGNAQDNGDGDEDGDGSALELAMLKQVVGNLKLTISVSDVARAETAGKLRTLELDIPCESVYGLLRKTRQGKGVGSGRGAGEARSDVSFLDGLRQAICLRTGLNLPLSDEPAGLPGQGGDDRDSVEEPPLRLTRVSCAAFALGTDGRVKFAKQPVQNAEVIGYDGDVVRTANWNLLETVMREAARQAND